MEIKPIRTPEDHAAALRAISEVWGAPEDTPEGDKLDLTLDQIRRLSRTCDIPTDALIGDLERV